MRATGYMQVRRKDGWCREWKSGLSWSGVLLDKYREKQRHGGSNENENKGALRNSLRFTPAVRRNDARKPRYVSDARYGLGFPPGGEKADRTV